MKTSISKVKIITFYYAVLGFILISQTVLTCLKLGQNISYQHKLQALTTYNKNLQKELETKQAILSSKNSLLAVQDEIDETYITITSPIVISGRATLALK